jgi:hypothetical protein
VRRYKFKSDVNHARLKSKAGGRYKFQGDVFKGNVNGPGD